MGLGWNLFHFELNKKSPKEKAGETLFVQRYLFTSVSI